MCFWPVLLDDCQYLWGSLLNPWVWFCMRRPGIYFRHVFLHLESVGGRHWIKPTPPATARTSSVLPRWELKYLSCADVTGFRSPSPDFLTGIVFRAPTKGERVFVFPNKRRGKKFSRIIFSTPTNTSPVSQVLHCRNIHPDWIACTTAA